MRFHCSGMSIRQKLPFVIIAAAMLIAVSRVSAVERGDSRQAVLAEKGPPLGRMETSSAELLKYADMSVKLQHGRVVAIQKSRTPAQPAGAIATQGDKAVESNVVSQSRGTLSDAGAYLVYRPAGLPAGKRYPLVFALSPTGDAPSLISTWSAVADKHRWIVVASKEFKRGNKLSASFAHIEATLQEVGRSFPIDHHRVIVAGFADGGMAAHAVAQFRPDRVRAIIVNTAMIQPSFLADDYPLGKTAVFLASPTDFRFNDMKRDRDFLESRGWKTLWVEFAGGHGVAPVDVYEQAATLLAKTL